MSRNPNKTPMIIKCGVDREDPVMRMLRDKIKNALLAGYEHFDSEGLLLEDEESILRAIFRFEKIVAVRPGQDVCCAEEPTWPKESVQ